MPNNNKNKGKSYEREIANKLSEIYNDSFLRNIDSGAFTGGSNSSRKDSMTDQQWLSRRGDVICPDGWALSIECKSYASLPYHQLIKQNCKQMDTWISQVEEVAEEDDAVIIFMKIARQGQYVAVKDFKNLDVRYSLQYKDYFIFDRDIFFEHNKEIFKTICKKGS